MRVGERTIVYHPELSVLLNAEVGDDCKIHAPVWIGHDVKIGHRCRVQAFCFIPTGVTIGDDVFLGPGVTFTNDKHPPSVDWAETIVGDGVSIGANATILPVTIGRGATVGAGAVVVHNVPPGATVVGTW